MTTFEKKIFWTIAVCIICAVVSLYYLGKVIDDAGGLKAIVIEAGKDVKDISAEIQKD